ncbi:MAG: alpha/beta fold hydrolase [Chitinivibrionales bacterium]|nr:alpha/beta fold hydrolase [Chitinivibrionales bacterium]MBD3356736.1 alpha/beta fold hydrolase [Chitinivibrionales bacterium]
MKRRYISAMLGGAAAFMAANFFRRYRLDLMKARRRVLGTAKLIETTAGPIEYAETGEGPPILVVHGAGGGHDQGMLVARLIGGEFRWIAPSRFGYLRTPMRKDASPEAQADAHAALLDALHVPAAGVVGVSAGAPSALTFAANHPARCRAVVLFSGLTRSAPRRSLFQEALVRYGFRWDMVFWALGKLIRKRVKTIVGAPPHVRMRLSAHEQTWLDDFLNAFLPIATRHEGLVADMEMSTIRQSIGFPLDRIRAPILAFQARDDNILPFAMLQYLSEYAPHARTIFFDEGGHLLLGHHQEVASSVRDFLHETALVAEGGRKESDKGGG